MKTILASSHSYGGIRSLSTVKYIVIHYTSGKGDTAENEGLYFKNVNKRAAGAHFFVGYDGTIVKSVELNRIAWAVGGAKYIDCPQTGGGKYYGKCNNANSVSIELCDNLTKDPSPRQIEGVKECIQYIRKNCPMAHTIIRHFDVTGKHCLPVEETELLTPNGWKYLKDIKKGDEVCEYDANTDTLRFAQTLDVVKPHVDVVFENRDVMATADHRMYVKPNCVNSNKFRDVLFTDIINTKSIYVIKNGADIETSGLPLSDNEIRLLVWIQGDGHYIKDKGKYTGVEFHLSKERKIIRICDLLDELEIHYSISKCKNGSQHIRIYDKSRVSWSEKWLEQKQFTYKLIQMDARQFEVFKNELLLVDGCKSGTKEIYTSIIPQNLDVVQAICATHGKRTNQQNLGKDYRSGVTIHDTNYTISGRYKNKQRKAVVSCVTVPSSYILIRQNWKTFIVGNCPARMMDSKRWDRFYRAIEEMGEPVSLSTEEFKVKILAKSLNVRVTPNVDSAIVTSVRKNEVYTITLTCGSWGKLKSGAGWINCSDKYVKRM